MKEPNYVTRPRFLAELKELLKKYNVILIGCNWEDIPYITTPSKCITMDRYIAELNYNDLRIDDPHAT